MNIRYVHTERNITLILLPILLKAYFIGLVIHFLYRQTTAQ